MKLLVLLAGVMSASALSLAVNASPATTLIPDFTPSSLYQGRNGGTLWTGTIPGKYAPSHPGPSYVYLPPHFSGTSRYPVAYLLHGMPGSPLSYIHGAHLAQFADQLIAQGAKPFIAVVPYAGPTTHRGLAEWAGQWENYIVDDVVPWTDSHLSTIRSAAGRVIGGLSAGGFGAIDIGLRHPNLFGTLESWSGYFTPVTDGPFVHATPAYLAAHNPTKLVRQEASLLRKLRITFELSTGAGHGPITPTMTIAFATELRSLHLPTDTWYVPKSIRGPDYHDQIQRGLTVAFAPAQAPAKGTAPKPV
jgi:hypothetical protein